MALPDTTAPLAPSEALRCRALLRRGFVGLGAAIAILGVARPGFAQEGDTDPPGGETPDDGEEGYGYEGGYEEADTDKVDDVWVEEQRATPPGRGASRVTRDDLDVRQPRSAPDALRYEPGVYVQQTAHAQGSAFVRGRTGQQTVLHFDDVRLNNSLFRQGPNQYFFTIDSRTIDHIEVLRGSASTRYGSDAIAGVIGAVPIEPTFDAEVTGLRVHPRAFARHATADDEWGGRLQLDAQLGEHVGVIGGVGYRDVGLLESSGALYSPATGELPQVPRFDEDGRTQLGTGFREWTGDARLVYRPSADVKITAAYYDYRQFDAPRTDQCPAAFAPWNECLKYDEQWRTVVYTAVDADLGPAAEETRVVLSWQRQHERRTDERPSSFVVNGGRDDVDSFGVVARATTQQAVVDPELVLRLRYGADAYYDQVESVAWLTFTDLDITRIRSRGQYLDGSSYATGGVWAEGEATLFDALVVRQGVRLARVSAQAPADVDSGTFSIDRTWHAVVGNVGIEWWTTPWLTLLVSADQGFRAPNLDDLTSRQQTGPGFQFENAALEPERATTLEAGVQLVTSRLDIDAWIYTSDLTDAIARAPRNADQCPPDTRQCVNSWNRFQLVNLRDEATIQGAEGTARLKLPLGVTLRSTVSYAWGDGPNPQDRPSDPALPYQERVPLSRIPPLNGTVEALWRGWGAWGGAALRWATAQDRLAQADVSDARIPAGGTPGFAVLDLRAGARLDRYALASIVFENVTDEVYRYHGSSVNGPGRGFLFSLEAGF